MSQSLLHLFKPIPMIVIIKTKLEKGNYSYLSKKKYNRDFYKNKISFKWDFCKQSSREMIYFLNKILAKYNPDNNLYLPLVMIGHSKDFLFKKNFENFFNKILQHPLKDSIEFSTYSSSIEKILGEIK